MATTYIVSVKESSNPDIVTIKVNVTGIGLIEQYDAPASITTDNTIIKNIVKLSRLGSGIVPIKAK